MNATIAFFPLSLNILSSLYFSLRHREESNANILRRLVIAANFGCLYVCTISKVDNELFIFGMAKDT
jgi:hypothetical protein